LDGALLEEMKEYEDELKEHKAELQKLKKELEAMLNRMMKYEANNSDDQAKSIVNVVSYTSCLQFIYQINESSTLHIL
jgi:chromosome segregation ATPase